MRAKFCYWSVATGPYAARMEHCVRTARAAGVFKEFHVLTDRPLEGCECYDAYACDKTHGLFKLHYLKVGMSRLDFDWFVWLDADTVFTRNPVDVLAPLGSAPIHVPLEVNLTHLPAGAEWKGASVGALRDLMVRQGVVNDPWLGGSAFWIVHHEAIETVYDLALGFWHQAREGGLTVDVATALGFAMQMLCAEPETHRLESHPELWAGDHLGVFRESRFDGKPWSWRHPLSGDAVQVHPAIVHLGNHTA
jgi:hypothetical protein